MNDPYESRETKSGNDKNAHRQKRDLHTGNCQGIFEKRRREKSLGAPSYQDYSKVLQEKGNPYRRDQSANPRAFSQRLVGPAIYENSNITIPKKAMYAETISRSPCAKFMRRKTPYTIE
jgi:hypothetical protein